MSLSPPLPDAGAPTDVVVACVQMQPRLGRKAENIDRSVRLAAQAASQGASIVVLPELCTSDYIFTSRAEAFAQAEPVPSGAATQSWVALAREMQIYLVAGITELDGNCLYNSAVVVGPSGFLGKYRKLHLWGDEHLYFEPGDLGLPVFNTPLGRLGVVVCYDGWFPEVYRLLAMRGVDIVCMPTCWVPMAGQTPQRMAIANTLAMANAHSNGLNIACADRVGAERGQAFIGQSLIVGADGWPLAGPASASEEEILYGRISIEASRRAKHLTAFNHVLRDRRDDVYDPMLGTGWPLPRH